MFGSDEVNGDGYGFVGGCGRFLGIPIMLPDTCQAPFLGSQKICMTSARQLFWDSQACFWNLFYTKKM